MLEYNTVRNKLVIKEYGRNVQKMIEQALSIEDREKRTESAKAIIKVMAQLNPNTKNNPESIKKQKESVDYWRKLWDHLYIISDYKLDIDSPFQKPEIASHTVQYAPLSYRKEKIHFRTYGRNMENIIKTASGYPDTPERAELTKSIANHLKKLYLIWNRDSVNDKLIVDQLAEMSGGILTLPEDFKLDETRDILSKNNLYPKSNAKNGNKKSKKKKKK